jgi:hypothetical protein
MCSIKTDAVIRHFIEYNAQTKIRFCPPIKNCFKLLPKGDIQFVVVIPPTVTHVKIRVPIL